VLLLLVVLLLLYVEVTCQENPLAFIPVFLLRDHV
jgi:hypothetical protein